MRFRQVHLDFHTSEEIPAVGDRFDKEQFKAALKAGHVDSITLFSKCHHGWAYHPSTANEMHPHLKFDLLGAQLEACREAGVNAPVYISAGFDEKYAKRHMDHLVRSTPDAAPNFLEKPGYHLLCFNTPYLDYLIAQVEEVMQKYNPVGVFLDISTPRVCYCQHCIASMREKGMNPHNPDDVKAFGEMVYLEYCRRVEEAVRKYSKTATIFHNAGNIARGKREIAGYDTHFELESLPTGGWGYDHFPMSAAYCRTLGKEYLGMTGKFHLTWGEFGGFKHPNALRYETSLSLALGARCSIGDQLHPNGEMNMSTYKLIGRAYAEVEQKEKYVEGAKAISDAAILSAVSYSSSSSVNNLSDTGASRILLESKILFDIIDRYEENLSKYKLIILPDSIRVDAELKEKLEKYLSGGGKLILSGKSGLATDSDRFAINVGAEYLGEIESTPSYLIPKYDCVNGETAYVMYTAASKIKDVSGEVIGLVEDSFFNRTPEHFCSHRHTPNKPGADNPGVVVTENTGYIAWNVFADYAENGGYYLKELVAQVIGRLMPERSVNVNLPDRGVVTYTFQEKENRYVAHLLFAHTSKRGKNVEIIEDIVPLYNIKLDAAVASQPKRVYKAQCEDGKLILSDLKYTYDNGRAYIDVDKVDTHAMVVIEL